MANESNGSMWVSGTYLHWMNASNTQFRFLGSAGSSPAGALPGSIWITGNTIHYIDSTGVDRTVSGPFVANRTGVGAKAGSLWVENNYAPSSTKGQLHYIGAAQDENWAHLDTAFSNSHTDSPFSSAHTNVGFYNSYTNIPYDDYHGDGEDAGGFYRDYYSDVPHTDSFGNTPFSSAHTNVPFVNSHTDTPHSDNPTTV